VGAAHTRQGAALDPQGDSPLDPVKFLKLNEDFVQYRAMLAIQSQAKNLAGQGARSLRGACPPAGGWAAPTVLIFIFEGGDLF